MILESIVTTVDQHGVVNIAPMGPHVNEQQTEFVLKPFESSRTYENLAATQKAVIHVTDDVDLLAKAAVGAIDDPQSLVEPVSDSGFWRLKDCHRWFAVEIESVSGVSPRFEMQCRVVDSELVRPFFGFNRAKHAVLEAAILATRTGILENELILSQLESLQPLVDKTAGSAERQAFDFLTQTIHERLADLRTDQTQRPC